MQPVTYRAGIGLVVLAGVLWSLMGLIIRLIDEANTWQVLFWRSAGMVPVLFWVLSRRSGGAPFARLKSSGWAGAIAAAGLVAAFAGAIYALQATTVANAIFLYSAASLFTAILAWPVLKEPVQPATWVAIALASLGIFVMVREGLAIGAGDGNIAALVSAAGFSAFTLAVRHARALDLASGVFLGGLASMAVAAIVLWGQGDSVLVPARDALIAMAMGALVLGFGMACYTAGSRAVPAGELALLGLIEVLLAPLWVWALLGETASAGTFAGGALLLAAITGNALWLSRRRGVGAAQA
ncbi:DMT family transporter [Frigidibacter sp.]|uniref:DMT family transporter n=1 Tax=Frigidibacter sp. TaxID=2586418 RepID=UPI00273330BF|nr:DMT family transporter [Frigidibacter sp.]MDP3341381.1 DMT family transporter [Frigidibacter sp.]